MIPFVLTAGIDLSSDPRSTAACVLEWKAGTVRIAGLAPQANGLALEDTELIEIIRGATKTGVDAPFGWPEPFFVAVSAWRKGGRWAWKDRSPMRYRQTDEQLRGAPKMPLSVSTDRLGATAMRCALLLSQLEEVDRSGMTGPAAEVYPAGGLHRWGLPSQGYKENGVEHLEVRRRIVSGLKRQFGTAWRPSPRQRRRLESEHDLLDAFISALMARAIERRRATTPRGNRERQLASIEGWIGLPTGELSGIL